MFSNFSKFNHLRRTHFQVTIGDLRKPVRKQSHYLVLLYRLPREEGISGLLSNLEVYICFGHKI